MALPASVKIWQLGKNRFIRIAASVASHGRGGGSGKGGVVIRLAGGPGGTGPSKDTSMVRHNSTLLL
ncbi:MAG: hypothetical protein ACTTKO_02310 [Candidatus Limimorpha sp.]